MTIECATRPIEVSKRLFTLATSDALSDDRSINRVSIIRRTSATGDVMPCQAQTHGISSNHRRPLIEQCTNEWRIDPKHLEAVKPESDNGWLGSAATKSQQMWVVTKAPKFQRLAMVFIFAAIISIMCWRVYLATYFAENKAAWDSISPEGSAKKEKFFGANKRVHFPGMVHIKQLDMKYLPRSSKTSLERSERNKRLIFIGDIHGCNQELQALLAKANYKLGQDHIVAVGDMIAKGPDSRGVVDYLMSQGASAVRGNHEDRILLVAKDVATTPRTTRQAVSPSSDLSTETIAAKKDREERALAKSLTREQLDWLNACPVILRIGDMGDFGEVVAVHAGLVPGISFEDQDPISVMNMRIVDLATHMPSQKHLQDGSAPWAELWNKYQKLMPPRRTWFRKKKAMHTTVVYGHDAKKGLQIDTYTKGLDSACVNGKKLTAWIVSDYGKQELVQVECKGYV